MRDRTNSNDDMLPEYDFTGGVRGKHCQAMRQGYTVKINAVDGTLLVQQFTADQWDRKIEEDLAAGGLNALLAEVEQEYVAGLNQPL